MSRMGRNVLRSAFQCNLILRENLNRCYLRPRAPDRSVVTAFSQGCILSHYRLACAESGKHGSTQSLRKPRSVTLARDAGHCGVALLLTHLRKQRAPTLVERWVRGAVAVKSSPLRVLQEFIHLLMQHPPPYPGGGSPCSHAMHSFA